MNQGAGFNPYSLESHYSLDMACYLLHREHPATVRICTGDVEIVKAAVRRLGWVTGRITVASPSLAAAVQPISAVAVEPYDSGATSDAILLPFARREYPDPPLASLLVSVTLNALSYKSLLYPGRTSDTVVSFVRWLRSSYHIRDRVGLFAPRFILEWAISQAAGTRYPALHFRCGQRALDHIYATGPLWWTGYILVVSASR